MNADDVREGWATRSTEYSPGYYAYYGPNETSERVRRVLDRLVRRDAAVLELGCSSGRHLEHLREAGYSDLHGVDINDDAFDVMAREYPDLAEAGTFHHGAIEDVVVGFEDDAFDVVFSVQTLQHVHADETSVFAELARIAGDLLVTVEAVDEDAPEQGEPPVSYENGDFPLYFRDWEAIFTDYGMEQVEVEPVGRDAMRVFRQE